MNSQPRPTTSTAATFGFLPRPASVRVLIAMSFKPRPQPSVWTMALTSGSSRPMACATPFAQLTELITTT